MIKRITSILLAMCIACGSFAACGKNNKDDVDDPKNPKSAENIEEELKYANGMAKSAYNAVMEYALDKNNFDGISIDETIDSFIGREIDCSGDRPADSGASAIYSWLDGEGYVIIFEVEISDMKNFAIQWRSSSDSDVIGQYPQPIEISKSSEAEWGEFMPGSEE